MKNETVKTGMKIGASIGGVVFLVFGIMPGFYFGSFGTLILLQKLMGGTVEPTLIARAIIVMGIVVGIACAAAVCLVVGGLRARWRELQSPFHLLCVISRLLQRRYKEQKLAANDRQPCSLNKRC